MYQIFILISIEKRYLCFLYTRISYSVLESNQRLTWTSRQKDNSSILVAVTWAVGDRIWAFLVPPSTQIKLCHENMIIF